MHLASVYSSAKSLIESFFVTNLRDVRDRIASSPVPSASIYYLFYLFQLFSILMTNELMVIFRSFQGFNTFSTTLHEVSTSIKSSLDRAGVLLTADEISRSRKYDWRTGRSLGKNTSFSARTRRKLILSRVNKRILRHICRAVFRHIFMLFCIRILSKQNRVFVNLI